MLTKMQANTVIRRFTAEEKDSMPREWICQIDVIGKNDMLHIFVGSVVKNKFKKIYRASNKGGVVGDYEDFNKAVASLIPSFMEQVQNKAFEICATLAGQELDFKGHAIKISNIDDNGNIKFRFTESGANEAESSVNIEVFAKNFILGNIKVK